MGSCKCQKRQTKLEQKGVRVVKKHKKVMISAQTSKTKRETINC